ncbi:tetratricopeptide repeat protein [Indioceanicola profundi]|uniref:tetratricopeptide repeat protein n=1 Tax=Indioceanicola profundi TaxID=2220096 RepID=UPI0013C4A993|nr:tetratricopeptide repeat protein [Indioceanicola profundi]
MKLCCIAMMGGVMALALPAVAAAQGFDTRDAASIQAVENLEAYAVYKMGQYDLARERWEALAAKGNTTAMINLSNMHAQGQGVPRDPAAARNWTRKAAELGDARAQLELGLAYERGDGVERNLDEAALWLGRAAEKGNAEAQFSLGVLLATGQGKGPEAATPEQRRQARSWLSKAAESGHEEAAAMLSVLK